MKWIQKYLLQLWTSEAKRMYFVLFQGALAIYCVYLLCVGVRIIAQDSRISLIQYQLDSNTHRIEELEKLNVDRRLALLEQAVQDIRSTSTLSGLGLVGVASLIAERIYSFARKGKDKE